LDNSFSALMVHKPNDVFAAELARFNRSELPNHDVLVRLEFSGINYKDALAITNSSPVVRRWPMIVGVDGAGVVEASDSAQFEKGDRVFVNGWGLGETQWGCLAQYARLKSEWLLPQSKNLSASDTMAIGTAGYTAMLCTLAIEKHGVRPENGEILVTGASGGVGGFAISILSDWGYRVVASTGRPEEAPYLHNLGAVEVVDRSTMSVEGKPLGKERWAAVVDGVGSYTLANACASTRYGGIVAACGLAQGMDLPTTVAPFILRGVTLKGIDSVMAPQDARIEAWKRLDTDLNRDKLKLMVREIALEEALDYAPQLMAGKIRGRIVVNTQ